MNEKETTKILATISAEYPYFMKDRDYDATIKLWQTVFEEDVYDRVASAVVSFIAMTRKDWHPYRGS